MTSLKNRINAAAQSVLTGKAGIRTALLSKEVVVPENPTFKQLEDGVNAIVPGAELTLTNFPTTLRTVITPENWILPTNTINSMVSHGIFQFSTKDRLYYARVDNVSGFYFTFGFIDHNTQTVNEYYRERFSDIGQWNNMRPVIFTVIKEGNNDVVYFCGPTGGSYSSYYLRYDLTNKVKLANTVSGLALYMYQQQMYDGKAFVKYDNLNNLTQPSFFLLDLPTGVRSDVMNLTNQSPTSHFNHTFYFNGKIWVVTDMDSGENRRWEFRRYDPSNGTFTLLQQEPLFNNSQYGVSFFCNGCIYFLGTIFQYSANAGVSPAQSLTFIIKVYDCNTLSWYDNQDAGYSARPVIDNTEQRGALVNGDNSEYCFFALDRSMYLNAFFTQFQRMELPCRTIYSIKGATYNIDKDAYVNGMLMPANRDFVLANADDVIRLSLGTTTVNGVIKIPSQNV